MVTIEGTAGTYWLSFDCLVMNETLNAKYVNNRELQK